MEVSYKYTVGTICFTYNHAAWITDALRGFVMQEVDFPVVYCIVDDASPDGEQDVLRNWAKNNLEVAANAFPKKQMPYGEIIVSPLKTDSRKLFVIVLLNNNLFSVGKSDLKFEYINEWITNSKYNALCEGDDYWIDPLKLKKQVIFLDSHPEFSMCFHNAIVRFDDSPLPAKIFNKIGEDSEVSLERLIDRWTNPTASMIYRSSILPFFPVKQKYMSGDWLMTLHCAACGKVWAMKDVMSVYRKTYHSTSSASRNRGKSAEMTMQKVYILEGLDEFTQGKYHDAITSYINYFRETARYLTLQRNKGAFIASILMPLYRIKNKFRKHPKN